MLVSITVSCQDSFCIWPRFLVSREPRAIGRLSRHFELMGFWCYAGRDQSDAKISGMNCRVSKHDLVELNFWRRSAACKDVPEVTALFEMFLFRMCRDPHTSFQWAVFETLTHVCDHLCFCLAKISFQPCPVLES
jgi:hypothetical protein